MKPTAKQISRRTFLHQGSQYLLAAGAGLAIEPHLSFASTAKPAVRFGMVTDMHYADKDRRGSRYYRETLQKLAEASAHFKQAKTEFVVELGDFIDRDPAKSVETELAYLKRIQQDFVKLPGKKHYVLGNHCIDTLTKKEFLDTVGQKAAHYSFDQGGVHFVVLDACYRKDGKPYGRNNSHWADANIPAAEVAWLKNDLEAADNKTIVFVHQRLDVDNNYAVKNAPEIRKVLEGSGKVLAVFQGHSHKNDHNHINGIHYCVHRAMVEGSGEAENGFSTLDVYGDGTIKITGFREQANYTW